jgi:hypothetical protein
MKEYKRLYNESQEKNLDKPKISNYIGECLWKISTGIASRPNFSGYSYIDEMIMDGIENCIRYLHKFDCEKYNNPHAYFSQIIWFAFLKRMEKEKIQHLIKIKALDHSFSDNELNDIMNEFGHNKQDIQLLYNEKNSLTLQEFEDKKDKKIKKKK